MVPAPAAQCMGQKVQSETYQVSQGLWERGHVLEKWEWSFHVSKNPITVLDICGKWGERKKKPNQNKKES